MSFDQLMGELNPQQHAAATTQAQHCLVLAGAGCGKTKTIVARAAYLIEQGVPANQIQILTFTRRSASEIVARVELALGSKPKDSAHRLFIRFVCTCCAVYRKPLV
ncbi:UvrD-helicase domain-containing protein [Acinetobacter soli]|nr:UvrD-helicase domain-containing protein [Acinetobacter soli]WEH97197.1 UvrD-helicase domain-containing protein [Acinetobacter soli]